MEIPEVAPASCSPSFLPNDHAHGKQVNNEIDAVVTQVATDELHHIEESGLERSMTPAALQESSHHEVSVVKPENVSSEDTDATGSIVAIALAAGVGVKEIGLGSAILQHGVAYSTYCNLTSGYMGTWRIGQYGAHYFAREAGLKAVNLTVCGVTAGTACTVATALLTAVTVAQVGVSIHNHCFAKTEEDKISINPFKIAKKAFAACTSFGAAAVA